MTPNTDPPFLFFGFEVFPNRTQWIELGLLGDVQGLTSPRYKPLSLKLLLKTWYSELPKTLLAFQ